MSSQPTGSGSRLTLDDLDVVVDADGHLKESVDDYLPYMDDEFAGVRKLIENSSHPPSEVFSHTRTTPGTYGGGERIGIEGRDVYTGSDGQTRDVKLSGDGQVRDRLLGHHADAHQRPLDGQQRRDGNRALPGVQRLGARGDSRPPRGTVHCDHRRAPGPHHAAGEIDRLSDEDGVVGVLMPIGGLQPPAGARVYDPIYQAAEDNGLAMLYHGSTGQMGEHWPTMRKGSRDQRRGCHAEPPDDGVP